MDQLTSANKRFVIMAKAQGQEIVVGYAAMASGGSILRMARMHPDMSEVRIWDSKLRQDIPLPVIANPVAFFKKQAVQHGITFSTITCQHCDLRQTCDFAFDLYNVDGKCKALETVK